MRRLLFVVLALAGCHKGDSSSAPGATGGGGTAAGPTAPASTTDQDALWALAPDKMVGGFVASPRAVAKLENGALAIKSLLATAPELAPFNTKLEAELTKTFGKGTVTLADLGLSHDKGGAVFATDDGGGLFIVPLGDHDKFIAATKGHADKAGDTINDMTCKTIGSSYVCAKPVAMFERLGKGKVAGPLAIAGARGDLEVVSELPIGPGKTISVSAVAQLDKGAFVLRAGASGLPAMVTSRFGAAHKAGVDAGTTSGFAVVDLSGMLSQIPTGDAELAPGVKMTDLIASIGAPITMAVAAGDTVFDIRVPLKNAAPVTALLGQCATFPVLAMMGAKLDNGVCHVPIPQMSMEIDAWVDGSVLRIGKKAGGAKGQPAALSGAGLELANGEWSMAMYGRGTMLGMPAFPGMPAGAATNPDVAPVLRGLALWNELGFGVRLDGDVVHALVTVRTAWANPDDVLAKVLAIPPADVISGNGAKTAKTIADASPDSPFATDFRAGYAGLEIPAAMVGMLSAVAIPAFTDYMKKSKLTEAQLQLNKIGKNAKVFFITNAQFPVGDATLSPAGACCAGPNHHCPVDNAVWQQPMWQALDFQIDDPNLFQYSYHSDGKTFDAKAIGDLDCDGTAITYDLAGTSDNGNPQVILTEPPPNSD